MRTSFIDDTVTADESCRTGATTTNGWTPLDIRRRTANLALHLRLPGGESQPRRRRPAKL
jgi:hypothetical protein